MKFEPTAEQEHAIQKWIAKRLRKKAYTGATGGRFTYHFCPTSIGTVVTVTDGVTNVTKDFTDYGDW